jgi:hypothetical protein
MEKQIAEPVAVCDMVRGHMRSPKKLWLSCTVASVNVERKAAIWDMA